METIKKTSILVNLTIFIYWSGWDDWLAHKDRWHWVVRDGATFKKLIESPQDYPSQEECDFAIKMFQDYGSLPQGQHIWGGTRHRKQRPFPPMGGAFHGRK